MNPILDSILLPYQKAWILDGSRFKIGMWSRQTGKSFSTAAEAVLDCLERPGQLWVCLSAGERQAFEWLRKARAWCEALDKAIFKQCRYEELSNAADASASKGEITFPAFGDKRPSRILAIPANPATARGYSANLILDEFAIHEHSWDIWAAIVPSITNPVGGEKKLRIVSTPKGMGNKFADLWHKNDSYSKHKVTIEDAVAAGLQVNLAELKAGVDDADIWAQEYLCEFIDASGVLLPYDLLAACTEDASLIKGLPPNAEKFVGMDIGRSHDLSVIIEGTKDTLGVLHISRVQVLRKMPFADQLKELIAAAKDARRVCVDATGIGAMLAEEAARVLGRKVEGVVFTAKSKGEMYGAMRRAFEEKTIRIPTDRDLREDLHAVEKRVSSGGTVTYSATRSEDGHSDRAAALALCLKAAASPYIGTPHIFSRLGFRTYKEPTL